jgi:hypothetical protein
MTANEWCLHDALMLKFGPVLYALSHPEILSTELTEEQRCDLVRHYIHNDPMAHHALRALVHIAIDASRPTYNHERLVTVLSDLIDLVVQMEDSEGYAASSQVFAARAVLAEIRESTPSKPHNK